VEARFKKLFEPLKIGPCTLKNRIIRGPMGSRQPFLSGEPSPQLVYRYGREAWGGAAMVISEITEVDGRHRFERPMLRVDSNYFVTGLAEMAEVIQLNGALACLQLRHSGMWGTDPVSPSGVPCFKGGGTGESLKSRVMSAEEVEEVIDIFADAAFRAQRAGFDMVELHGGTSYLLEQFVSPHTNKRTDVWGGTFGNRIRLPLEIVRKIRQKCGPDFPVGYRIVLDELLPDGITFDEAMAFAKRLEKEGIAYLNPMLGTYETFHLGEGWQSYRSPKAQIVKYTVPLKNEVSIPVFAGGTIHEPEIMAEILEKNQADAISLARPFLADPDLPKKIKEGRLEDIGLCIICNHCADTTLLTDRKLTCTQNPESGRGREFLIQPAVSPKKVLVIGGGPAGLEAGKVAALRGHNVTLLEKESEPGGQVRLATIPIGKEEYMSRVIGWRVRQCEQAGVKIELGREATPEAVAKYAPDVVIVATGANPCVPEIPGVDAPNAVVAWDVLNGQAKVGKRVVIAGGGLVGVEIADYLAENGLAESVTIIEMLPQIATDMSLFNKAYLVQKLDKYGVTVITNTQIRQITDKGVVAVGQEGEEMTIEADTVIIALGSVAENKLAQELEGKVPEIYTIGDCKKPRELTAAILEGAYVGRQI